MDVFYPAERRADGMLRRQSEISGRYRGNIGRAGGISRADASLPKRDLN
jgi:hypothetical protein